MDSIASEIQTAPGCSIHLAELPRKGEDRTAVLQFQHGLIIAIFDGHCGSQLSDYAAQTLPKLLAERLDPVSDPATNENWSDPKWLDSEVELCSRFGQPADSRYISGLRATAGSTVLVAFLDQTKQHLWVASLGDSDAVCARNINNTRTVHFLSERHNCDNPTEVERVRQQHPNESDVLQYDSLLGTLRITRGGSWLLPFSEVAKFIGGLGDHQLKVPIALATRILPYYSIPPRLEASEILSRHYWTPPYVSNKPYIHCHDILEGDTFILASDGLRDALLLSISENQKFDIIFALADGKPEFSSAALLQHECIVAKDGDNMAEQIIINTLFGTDMKKRARELDQRASRDDISVVYQPITNTRIKFLSAYAVYMQSNQDFKVK
ncbi:protein serine threonine phosphatase 2C [Favolaschia claudopus]|uniref:Protein serine threonine phosphatase 2C n=1 Tax=Favolaschia claudopus TaxID=2862362 RepID=A0AAW0ARU3_9AGAR